MIIRTYITLLFALVDPTNSDKYIRQDISVCHERAFYHLPSFKTVYTLSGRHFPLPANPLPAVKNNCETPPNSLFSSNYIVKYLIKDNPLYAESKNRVLGQNGHLNFSFKGSFRLLPEMGSKLIFLESTHFTRQSSPLLAIYRLLLLSFSPFLSHVSRLPTKCATPWTRQ